MNYFEIFDFKEEFDIDLDILEKKYLEFQSKFHPDNAGISEVEKSIEINEAYKILSDDFLRLSYILKLSDIDILDDIKAPKVDFETLEKILELQEQIAEISNKVELDNLKIKLNAEIKLQISASAKLIKTKEFELSSQFLIKAKYLKKALEDLKIRKKKIK